MAHICKAKNFLVIGDEAEWGVFPDVPEYYHLPVFDYTVRARPVNRQSRPFVGVFPRLHNQNTHIQVAGQLVTSPYGWVPDGLDKSFAEYLLTWAFGGQDVCELDSKFTEWAEGPNVANKRHLGLRVNSATLQGSEGQMVTLTLDLLGKQEIGQDIVTTAQTLPSDRNGLVEMEMSDCDFFIGGSQIGVRAFALRISNELAVRFLDSTTPQLMVKKDRRIEYAIVPVKDGDTIDALRRTTGSNTTTGRIKLKALHSGTGTSGTNWTVLDLIFPKLAFVDADEEGGIDDIAFQPRQYLALLGDPDLSGGASVVLQGTANVGSDIVILASEE